MHGEAGSANPEAGEMERARLHVLMQNKAVTEGRVGRDDIYNADETAFYSAAPPTREKATRSKKTRLGSP